MGFFIIGKVASPVKQNLFFVDFVVLPDTSGPSDRHGC